MPGPAPDPNALRRDREGEWLTLPASGRDGDTPPWPLSRDGYNNREAALWAALWCKPQAVAWERNGLEYEVAMHVRTLAAAEKPDALTTVRQLAHAQQRSLGLTEPGMRTNRWVLSSDEVRAKRQNPGGPTNKRPQIKRVVNE